MKIYGCSFNDALKFEKIGGADIISYDNSYTDYSKSEGVLETRLEEGPDGKPVEVETIVLSVHNGILVKVTAKGQLHIPTGTVSKLTGFFREYLSPYSWKSVYIEEKGQDLKRALIYLPSRNWCPMSSTNLAKLGGESPYWAKLLGNGSLIERAGQEFLIKKDALWKARMVGFSSGSRLQTDLSKDEFFPIYRVNTLLKKIKMIFWRIWSVSSPWMEVKSPSNGEIFWVRTSDYKAVCKLLDEDLTYIKGHPQAMAIDSNIHWVTFA